MPSARKIAEKIVAISPGIFGGAALYTFFPEVARSAFPLLFSICGELTILTFLLCLEERGDDNAHYSPSEGEGDEKQL